MEKSTKIKKSNFQTPEEFLKEFIDFADKQYAISDKKDLYNIAKFFLRQKSKR